MTTYQDFETDLCRIAFNHGTDKGTNGHFYTAKYHELLKDKRETITKVMEIGIDRGWSLLMWREYFPNATIYGADIDYNRLINEPRIRSKRCDQSDVRSLYELIPWVGGDFGLIVDDGSHVPEHQILTAKALLPLLSPDGVYVIEDVGHPDLIVPHFPGCEVYNSEKGHCGDDRLIIMRNP